MMKKQLLKATRNFGGQAMSGLAVVIFALLVGGVAQAPTSGAGVSVVPNEAARRVDVFVDGRLSRPTSGLRR